MAGPGVISFTRTEKYSSLVAQELKEIRDAKVFSDFKISVKGENFPCHRLVVSVHSAMLKATLLSDMAEAAKHSVNLDHIDVSVMKTILDYMYIGQISFQVEQLSDLIIACDYLRINMLKELCVNHVPSILQPANAVTWLKLSHKLDLDNIKSECFQIIVANFTTISKQPDFVDLSIVTFQECLSHVQDSSQQQDSQDDILDVALRWVDRDSTERLDHLEKLMDHIQLDLCSQQGILRTMKTYKAIVNTADTVYDQLLTAMEMASTGPKSKPTLAIVGGQVEGQVGDYVSRVCWKVTDDKEVVEMFRIPFDELQTDHSVCSKPDGFIISGGKDSKLCIMFSAQTMKWSKLQNLQTSRRSHGSIFIKGVLYVVGGCVEGANSKSVHFRFIEGGSWQETSDLPDPLYDPKVAELDDSIYLLDEKTGQLLHMDVDQRVWTKKASLPFETYWGVSMTSHNGKLYVARKDVFAWYTPETDTWVQGQKPNKFHRYGSLVRHDNKLLLLGGSWNDGTDEVEEYDFERKTWSDCGWKLPLPLERHHAMFLDMTEGVCQACGI